MNALALLIALQIHGPGHNHEQSRVEALRRLEELSDLKGYELAKAREREYRRKLLEQVHLEFVEKFNAYADKFISGALPVKEQKEMIKAWKKLEAEINANR
jgi:hypothetical protein